MFIALLVLFLATSVPLIDARGGGHGGGGHGGGGHGGGGHGGHGGGGHGGGGHGFGHGIFHFFGWGRSHGTSHGSYHGSSSGHSSSAPRTKDDPEPIGPTVNVSSLGNETMTLPPLCSDCNATLTEEQQKSPPWSLLLLFAKAQAAIGRGAQRILDFWRGQPTRADLLDAIGYAVPTTLKQTDTVDNEKPFGNSGFMIG
ncbi:hypothetical protein AAVH_31744 [Aphelenchoides avenae]|nr:hypothetical protein AAVH_31744 [Aphelenchus avenae]